MQADKNTNTGLEKAPEKAAGEARPNADNADNKDNKDSSSSARPRSGFSKDRDEGGSSEGKFAGGGEQSSWFGDIAPPDLTVIDYKDIALLSRFTSNHGKIMPGRLGDISHKDQRKISKAIKRARQVALIPYSSR